MSAPAAQLLETCDKKNSIQDHSMENVPFPSTTAIFKTRKTVKTVEEFNVSSVQNYQNLFSEEKILYLPNRCD